MSFFRCCRLHTCMACTYIYFNTLYKNLFHKNNNNNNSSAYAFVHYAWKFYFGNSKISIVYICCELARLSVCLPACLPAFKLLAESFVRERKKELRRNNSVGKDFHKLLFTCNKTFSRSIFI